MEFTIHIPVWLIWVSGIAGGIMLLRRIYLMLALSSRS